MKAAENNSFVADGKRHFYAIDLVKFVCALLVVTLHIVSYAFSEMSVDGVAPTGHNNVAMTILMPAYFVLARLAVPFFFIASSYFLFKKIKENPENRNKIIKKYCLRIFLLYLFWFVVSIPITIDKYFIANNAGGGFWHLILKIVIQGGYSGAWYLITSLVSVFLVNLLSKYSVRLNLVIAIVFYAISCLFCSYFNVFSFIPNSKSAFAALKNFNVNFPVYLTFLNGFVFVLIGRLFAEKENLMSNKTNKFLLFICPILMYFELFVTIYFSLNIATDCFFTLVPASMVLFQFVKNLHLKPRNVYQCMRRYSTFLYLYHFVFLYVFYRFVYAFHWTIFISNVPMTILVYIVIVLSAMGLCELNFWLSKKKGFKFLKYSL